jgi:hypothetical protein
MSSFTHAFGVVKQYGVFKTSKSPSNITCILLSNNNARKGIQIIQYIRKNQIKNCMEIVQKYCLCLNMVPSIFLCSAKAPDPDVVLMDLGLSS